MVKDIVSALPGTAEWMVMFRIDGIKRFADSKTIIDMYFLHPETPVDTYDFVVLSSLGRFLYRASDRSFTHGETLEPHNFGQGGLYEAYRERLDHFDMDRADSLATGLYPGYGQVVLYIRFGEHVAHAESIFNREPDRRFYENLQAVGIRLVSGEYINGRYLAKYENTLSRHIRSGILADFSRTDNCNLFFFLHGNINEELADGLFKAGRKRLEHEQQALGEKLTGLAEKSMAEKLQMSMLLPDSPETVGFGDVVPKGFIYGALNDRFPGTPLTLAYQASLENDKLRGLWTFESKDLETSVDSSLVLMNTYDREAAVLLAKFEDPETGAYLPQRDALNPQEGDMQYVPEKDHWCRDNIATSALIAGELKKHGLPLSERLARYVTEKFEQRSDLYFANPFFVDWLYAQGLRAVDGSEALRERLKNEILSAVGEDYSVGGYDKVFSTACAILALHELQADDNLIFALQLYVLNHYRIPSEQTPIPFYSSLLLPEGDPGTGRVRDVNGRRLSIYLYRDEHAMIYTALVSRALNLPMTPSATHEGLEKYISRSIPDRYACTGHEDYIARFSLPNYV